jgi:hypothetical protein
MASRAPLQGTRLGSQAACLRRGLPIIVAAALSLCPPASAQEAVQTNETNWLDAIKQIPLNVDGSWYVTFGGELRTRYESSRNPVFGLGAPEDNDYVLQRTQLFADVHFGPHLRTFVELASGLAPGWNGNPPPTQKDELDFQQAFGDLAIPVGAHEFTLRVGRQEMFFGSSRLISVRESPNVQRSFDGVRVSFSKSDDFRIDGFLVRPVNPKIGTFNDSSDSTQLFWGVYATTVIPGLPGKADLYYLGLDRDDAHFAQGLANEHRHTVGARLFEKERGVDWNLEAAFQFGSFGESDIRAWTVSLDAGYTFADLPFSPRLGLNADAISGDHDLHDRTLATFNPLFPKLPYFSEANLATPANLVDVQPNLTLTLTPRVTFNVGWNPLWKEAEEDAFYAPPLTAIRGTTGGSGRFVGQQLSTTVNWTVTDRLSISGTYVHYTPGDRLREAGGKSGDFFATWVQLQF